MSKITQERNQRTILDLSAKPGNDVCADCKARNPRWASHNLGIFICVNCASIHRKIGTHISKVKSLTLDSWTKEQVENMSSIGNFKSNALYNPNESRHPPPVSFIDAERDSELEQYIRAKYEYKRFFDKSSLVASKLGPSRSLASISSRSQSSQLSSSPSTPGNGPLMSNISPSASTSASLSSRAQLQQLQRPSTAALPNGPATSSALPVTQTRSVSQPLSSSLQHPQQPQYQTQPQPQFQAQQQQQQPPPQQNQQQPTGVWADLVSLQTPSSSSSLPLQFQAPGNAMPQMGGIAFGVGGMPNQMTSMGRFQNGMSGMGMGMGAGAGARINPFHQQQQQQFQQQQFTPANSFAQPQQQPPYTSQSLMSPFGGAGGSGGTFDPNPQPMQAFGMPQQQQQQQYFPSQMQVQSPVATPGQGQFFQPQPQQFMSHSPQPPLQGQFGAGSTSPQPPMQLMQPGQRFISTTTSPPQFMSSTTPQPQFMSSTTPQPQFMSNSSPQPQMQMQGQFGGYGGQQGPGQGQWGTQGGYPIGANQQWRGV